MMSIPAVPKSAGRGGPVRPKSPMHQYRRVKFAISILLVGHLAAVLLIKILAVLGTMDRPGEIFPVFTWSLFSRVPNHVQDFAIRIHSIDNIKLRKPTYLESLHDTFPHADAGNSRQIVDRLGHALTGDRTAEIAQLTRQLEEVLFHQHDSVEYEVVQRSYMPANRWRDGPFHDEITIIEQRFAK